MRRRLRYHPVFLDTSISEEGEALETYLLREHGVTMAQAAADDYPLNRAASELGFRFHLGRRIVDTARAFCAVALAVEEGARAARHPREIAGEHCGSPAGHHLPALAIYTPARAVHTPARAVTAVTAVTASDTPERAIHMPALAITRRHWPSARPHEPSARAHEPSPTRRPSRRPAHAGLDDVLFEEL